MKKSRIVFLATVSLLSCKIVFSQTESTPDRSLKYFNKTEAGVSIGIGYFNTDFINGTQKKVRNDEIVVTVQTVNGFKYMDKIGVGISVGAEIWQNGLFWPICGYLGYDLKPADNTFFANLYLGSAICKRYKTNFYESGKGAFTLTIGLGYKMKLNKKLRFMYEFFYHYQAIESSYKKIYSGTTDTTTIQLNYTVPLNFAGFKIGICFP